MTLFEISSKNKFNLTCDLNRITSAKFNTYQNMLKLNESLTDLNASIDLQMSNDKENTENIK